jgi:hypothetical protein
LVEDATENHTEFAIEIEHIDAPSFPAPPFSLRTLLDRDATNDALPVLRKSDVRQ